MTVSRSLRGEPPPPAQGAFPRPFGRYLLLRPWARGGMGELMLATCGELSGLRKLCVVKTIPIAPREVKLHQRFLQEASISLRLNHPNIVQTFDAGRVGTTFFLAMELVEGQNLSSVCKRALALRRSIPPAIAMWMVREAARGLAALHDLHGLRLVHRDVSPSNVMIGYRGDVKLLDFGLSFSQQRPLFANDDSTFGQLAYLAPEQAQGRAASQASDVFALGIMLWELVTGRSRLNVSDTSRHDVFKLLQDPNIVDPTTLVPELPPAIDVIIERATALDPNRRCSARDLAEMLSALMRTRMEPCDYEDVHTLMQELFTREQRLERLEYEKHLAWRVAFDTAANSTPNSIVGDLPPDSRALRRHAERRLGMVLAGRYRIDGILAMGGMGAVYRAMHVALEKPFALKVLHDVYRNDTALVRRFLREARSATQTRHPNLVDVVDVGSTLEGDVYFVMELLEGKDLGKLLAREAPWPISRIISASAQICEALDAAHAAQIVHRDLKPENVFLTHSADGRELIKVLDFGICKREEDRSHLTTPGLILGSPDYMAPEQAAGGEYGPTIDIYALGCLMFEMLTGKVPFPGGTAVDILARKRNADAPPVLSLRPETPAWLAELVDACLSRDISRRPNSMRSIADKFYRMQQANDRTMVQQAQVIDLGTVARKQASPPRAESITPALPDRFDDPEQADTLVRRSGSQSA